MYGYVYLTIDNLKGYFYIGQHKSETYDEKYFGSGLRIHNIIKKRGGTETLRNYILQKCDSKSHTGKIWVHNEFERTTIWLEQLEEYLNKGFERGKGKHNKR